MDYTNTFLSIGIAFLLGLMSPGRTMLRSQHTRWGLAGVAFSVPRFDGPGHWAALAIAGLGFIIASLPW